MKKLLIIGMVWPEPTSSAAGTRMVQLIDLFLSQNFEITFACAASKSDFSHNLIKKGIKEQAIKLNDSSFNAFAKDLAPDMVLYDRFMIEEQYAWRVNESCPNALQILDTEDLHFLRQARQESTKKKLAFNSNSILTDVAKREIASILRCDLSLIISETEMDILQNQFKINKDILYYLPFLEEEINQTDVNNWKTYSQRKDFVFIGNFLHEPNWHTVQYLKTNIWPKLRKMLPGVALNIYGAYPSQKVLQLENKTDFFFIKGRAADAKSCIASHKVLLAPIQFGAGVKGKFIDAMQTGTPSVTTAVGVEAMKGNLEWSGFIENDAEQFIEKAFLLYQNESVWQKAQQNGIKIINQRYSKLQFENSFIEKIGYLNANLHQHRAHNFIGQILKYHTANSTKYMSLWIEEKNK